MFLRRTVLPLNTVRTLARAQGYGARGGVPQQQAQQSTQQPPQSSPPPQQAFQEEDNAGSEGQYQEAPQGGYQSQSPRLRANLNKVMLMGTVGQNPRVFTFSNNSKKVTFPLATNETYRAKDGQFKNITEWHTIAVYQDNLGSFIVNKITKGAQVYVEGSIASSKIVKDGVTKHLSEIRINPYSGNVKILHRGPPQQDSELTYVNEEDQQKQEESDYVA